MFVLGCSGGGGLLDSDGDGSPDSEDCGPDDAGTYSGAPDPYGVGGDTDCDGLDGVDRDADGYPANEELAGQLDLYDCNDNDPMVNPGTVEVPGNGLDEDCDGFDEFDSDGDGTPDSADCDPEDALLNHEDADGDGWSSCEGDCDDEDPELSPRDADGDGASLCEADCDDDDPTRFPGAAEECNRVDDDCDGELHPSEFDGDLDGQTLCEGDCEDSNPAIHALDLDGDGSTLCDAVPDCDDGDVTLNPTDADDDLHSSCSGDCDDDSAATHPTASEVCDGQDNNCDGVVPADEIDADADGAAECAGDCDDGDDLLTTEDADGDGYSTCLGDCDDGDPGMTPADQDGDGSSSCQGDCVDTNPAVGPTATEVCDGLDTDCSGTISSWEVDGDGDGFLSCEECDDTNAAIYPSAWDSPGDGLDGNCDGLDHNGLGSMPAIRLAQTYSTVYEHIFKGADVGDVDGDGLVDLVVRFGDRESAPYSFDWPGQIVLGSQLIDGLALNLGLAPIELTGFTQTSLYDRVQFAGDFDGDGRDDLIFAGLDAYGTGVVWLVSGASLAGGGSFDISAIAAVEVSGFVPGDQFGFDVASGDFDGDGTIDLAVAAPGHDFAGDDTGTVFVFLSVSLASGDLTSADADLTLYGVDPNTAPFGNGNGYGIQTSPGGDIDGDGSEDLLVVAGDYGANGEAYVFLGAGLSTGSPRALSSAEGLLTPPSGLQLGTVVAVGDTNGDGLGDLVGLSQVVGGGPAGLHLVGGADLLLSPVELGPSTQASAAFTDAWLGPMTAVGDVNGNGVSEIAIPTGNFVYILEGSDIVPGADLSAADALAAFAATVDVELAALCSIPPVYPATGVGCSGPDLASLYGGGAFGGDVDGDGLSDLIIVRGVNGPTSLAAYVLLSPY